MEQAVYQPTGRLLASREQAILRRAADEMGVELVELDPDSTLGQIRAAEMQIVRDAKAHPEQQLEISSPFDWLPDEFRQRPAEDESPFA
jgi:hypothetical protein